MPPKTEEMQLAVVHGDSDDSTSMPYSPCSSTVSTTSGFKRSDSCCFSFVELQQPCLLLSEGTNVAEAFETSLGYLTLRVEELAARTMEAVQSLENPDDSPVLKACTMSLHSRVPLLLKQASLLIHQLKCQNSDKAAADRVITGRLRSNFALVRLVQYLDLIESAMQNPPRELLDARLLDILRAMNMNNSSVSIAGNTEQEQAAFFRVSPWLAKTLAFDLPLGQTASTQLAGNLPLEVEVEPIFEIHAADVVAGKLENWSFCACSVVIQSCKHKATPFSSGAGMIGECIIRVHVTPLHNDKKQPVSTPARAAWSESQFQKKLVIREARAVQVNAYPPKPKANVDLYTSHLYGDAQTTH
jgi:hypothetical protein